MKAYLITTGIVFGLIALMHLLRSIAEWDSLSRNPGEFFAMAALGVFAAGLAVWAVQLLRRQAKA